MKPNQSVLNLCKWSCVLLLISQKNLLIGPELIHVQSTCWNIPLNKTINIWIDCIHYDNNDPPQVPKDNFCNLYNIISKESFLTTANKCHKNLDGEAMGLSLDPALTNIFEGCFWNSGMGKVKHLCSVFHKYLSIFSYISPKVCMCVCVCVCLCLYILYWYWILHSFMIKLNQILGG